VFKLYSGIAMTSKSFSEIANFIWSVADILRGDFKQSQYGRIILPFTLLRRLECVLEPSKKQILEHYQQVKSQNLPEESLINILQLVSNLSFYNLSPMNLSKLGYKDIRSNLNSYIQSFSKNAREIFTHFKFEEHISSLQSANLLYKVVEKFAHTDLSPEAVSNYEMGLVFEELIRRFAENSNETAGEHFTPRDIVELVASLVVIDKNDVLSSSGKIVYIYDPTAGTGGFLSSAMETLHAMNSEIVPVAFGQELNPESYAICKADMLIKGQDPERIKLGNTLTNDKLRCEKFEFMLSNPPFGVDWKKDEDIVKTEHLVEGYNGRFGAGLPRVSDGSLLFLLHMFSKMKDVDDGGSRIGIILNGSPLFTGSAGSGESEIRRHILENDLLEAIVALPNDMFYNTGIATYIWILTNNKNTARKGKVQLINAVNLFDKMRKSLGSKRNYLTEEHAATVIQTFGQFSEASQTDPTTNQPLSKVFKPYQFGYRRITIERPLRLACQFTGENIEKLRYSNKANYTEAMQMIYHDYGHQWTAETYGELNDFEADIRVRLKQEQSKLKEKDIKEILNAKLWLAQKALMEKTKQLQQQLGTEVFNDFNTFEPVLKKAAKAESIEFDKNEYKQLIEAISWKEPKAEPVIKKSLKTQKSNPLYGEWSYQGKIVTFETDSELRDYENIPLNPKIPTKQLVEDYFTQEVAPHVPDAWINAEKKDHKDQEIGIVGYEIPFNRHFYIYQPPRPLEEIDAELDQLTSEIMQLLREVHS